MTTKARRGAAGRALGARLVLPLALLLGAPDRQAGVAAAQTAGTPVTEAAAFPAREILLRATLERTGADPLGLQLLRITLGPGGRSALHTHPGVEFGVVESGRLAVLVTGPAVLLPAGARSAGSSETIPSGVEVTLEPGDRIAYATGTGMTFRNPGPEPTTLLAATVLPAGPDAPPGAVYPEGTPGPDEVAGVESRILGEAVAAALPVGRGAITLERLVVRDGEAVPGFGGPVLVAVEEGGLSLSVLRGEVEAAPASSAATADTAFDVVAGGSLFLPEGMAETPPLGGEGEVVLLRLGIVGLGDGANDLPTIGAATPPPTDPAVAELPVGTRVVVVVPEARLRAAPSLAAAVLGGVLAGRALIVSGPPVTDESGQAWYPVEDAADPTLAGFVAVELVVPDE